MFTRKEIISILIATIILGFVVSPFSELNAFFLGFLLVLGVVLVNVLAKKAMAHYLDTKIEFDLWTVKRYGFTPAKKFKHPFPAAIIIPLFFALVSLGTIKWMTVLVFEPTAKVHRAARRHGLYTFSEITEGHTGLIAGMGVIASLLAALIAYLFNAGEFARLSIYFAFFNILPISNLDGTKIFFGNKTGWTFLATLATIALAYTIFIT